MQSLAKYVILITFLLIAISLVNATEEAQSLILPEDLPGSSPYPVGKEPFLTHTVKVFWITEEGIDRTELAISAQGNRPSQLSCQKFKDKEIIACKEIPFFISPDCEYHYNIVNSKVDFKEPALNLFKVDGKGIIEVKVFGSQVGDYSQAPLVRVYYYQGDKLLGETTVTAWPVSEKLKSRQITN